MYIAIDKIKVYNTSLFIKVSRQISLKILDRQRKGDISMQLKKYETLYILFAIAVSLSGIYLKNNSEAFSPFIYAFSEQTEQYLESYNLADTDTEPCTEETLGIHNSRTARLLACKFLKQKNNTKISTNIIHSNILPSQEGVFYI